jgi:tripartite-type tricarboxylate transporter receptor subunit TctC
MTREPQEPEDWCRLLTRAAVALVASIGLGTAWAQSGYPSKPIRLISPFPPGAVVDTLCRTLAPALGELLGQPVVVENRTGAGGNVGMDLVAKAAPDGYTIGMGSIGTHGINPNVYKMPFDPVRDFVPISFVASNINVLVVHPSVPAQNVSELIAYARANPGKLSYGSAGTGTSQHLAGELFKQLARVEMTHIPYKGAGPAVSDLVGGQIPLMFVDISASLGHIRAGKLRALGVTTRERSPLVDAPTVIEQGIADFDVNAWFGLFAPAGTPRELVARLNAETVKALRQDATRERLEGVGLKPAPNTPEEFGRFVRAELERWAKVARSANLRAE